MSAEASGRALAGPGWSAEPEPQGVSALTGDHPSRGVSAEFRAKIESEMAELGMAPHPLALEAAYAIWLYSQPDGFVIYQGPDESECYGYAWRALEAAGIPSASGIAAPEGSEPKVRTEGKSPIGVAEAPQAERPHSPLPRSFCACRSRTFSSRSMPFRITVSRSSPGCLAASSRSTISLVSGSVRRFSHSLFRPTFEPFAYV